LCLLHHAAGVHHGDALGEIGDDPHVMRDQEDRRAVIALSRFIN